MVAAGAAAERVRGEPADPGKAEDHLGVQRSYEGRDHDDREQSPEHQRRTVTAEASKRE
jgi:hypothetical protein